MRRLVHYAAACETSDNLQLLIEKGANLADIDTKKTTCLHTAAVAMRAHNVKLILEKSPELIALRDRKGMTALAYAC